MRYGAIRLKLFAVYVGGLMEGANIEVHDMRFVAAPRLSDTYAELRRQWWGRAETLHIDCWAEIDAVDGFSVTLSTAPSSDMLKLYYVNIGGYDPGQFTEQHRNVFVVASTEAQAKARALAKCREWTGLHKDNLYEAEQVFCLNHTLAPLHIHLVPGSTEDFSFHCAYKPIGTRPKL